LYYFYFSLFILFFDSNFNLYEQGARAVISYHTGRVSQALHDLFPNFDKSKYQAVGTVTKMLDSIQLYSFTSI
jgi:hypothetical protein